ncbi:MAG: hypothetical protein GX326_03595, partial [Clostridiaceae bacterium]|nr:hypothetical protein [Clostridiaceae bacterium]
MKADKKEKYQEIKENTNLIKEIIIEFEKDYEVLEDQDIQDLDYLNFSKELIKRLNKKYNTDKIIAFLDTGEAGIREIIAFDPNSDFFDRRNIKGEYEYSGTLFLYKENESITDPYINIFGHSMQDKTRLGKLLDYPTNKESLVKANLFTNEGIYQYELVQVSEIDTVSDDDYLTWQKDDFFRFYEDSSKSGLIEQLEKPDVEASYM